MTTQTMTGALRQRPLWPFSLARHAAPQRANSTISPTELRQLVAAMVD